MKMTVDELLLKMRDTDIITIRVDSETTLTGHWFNREIIKYLRENNDSMFEVENERNRYEIRKEGK